MSYPYSDNLYSADSDFEPENAHGLASQQQDWIDPLQGRAEQRDERDVQLDRQATLRGSHRYSDRDDDDDDDDDGRVFLPSDGYFHAAPDTDTAWQTLASLEPGVASTRSSNNVPRVPNVWVTDPSLQEGSTAESKAREAERERLERIAETVREPTPPPVTPVLDPARPHQSATPTSSSTWAPSSSHSTHYQPSSFAYTPWSAVTPYTSHAPRQAVDERSSLFHTEAPPAYTPSPTSPTLSQGSSPSERNYRTFPAAGASMGNRSEETQGLLARPPQSMTGLDVEAHRNDRDDASGWRARVVIRVPRVSFRRCWTVVFVLVLVLGIVGSLTRLIGGVGNERETVPKKDPVIKDPVERPPADKPSMDYPDLDSDFHWKTEHVCGTSMHHSSVQFDLAFGSGQALSVTQVMNEGEGRQTRVSGDVILRRVGTGTPGPSIVFDIISNSYDMPVNAAYGRESSTQNLLVSVPRQVPWDETGTWPCVNIRVTVWVPEDGSLDGLAVDTVHLDIKLMDNLSLKIGQQTTLKSVVGTITAGAGASNDEQLPTRGVPSSFRFDSRHIEVRTTSAPIAGAWPLYDYLGLQASSGVIRVGIDPKPAAPSGAVSKPAILYVKTTSGDVELREPVHAAAEAEPIPPRDYRVQVQTTSGKIAGALAFSSSCRLRSTSADMAVELLPVLDGALAVAVGWQAELETTSSSGVTAVTVLDPLWVDLRGRHALPSRDVKGGGGEEEQDRRGEGDDRAPIPVGKIGNSDPYGRLPSALPAPTDTSSSDATGKQQAAISTALRCLRGKHTTTSADLRLVYPAAWEGDIDLGSVTGQLWARGEGVRVIRRNDDWGVNKRLAAHKGAEEGGGLVVVRSTTGDVDVLVGSE